MVTEWEAEFRTIKEDYLDQGWDWVVCYDGDERSGKSTVALQADIYVDENLRQAIECEDWKVALDHTSHDFEEMVRKVRMAPSGSHHYDEASLLAREAMQPWNIRMVKVLSVVGFLQQLYSFNFPNFWDLDPFLREHRVLTRCLVRSFGGRRGYCTFYARHKKDFPSSGRKVWWEHAFDHVFLPFDAWSEAYREFWARYEESDRKAKMALLAEDGFDPDLKVVMRMRNLEYPFTEIAPVLDISTRHLYRRVKVWRKQGHPIP